MSDFLFQKSKFRKQRNFGVWEWGITIYCLIYFTFLTFLNLNYLDLSNFDESLYIRLAEQIFKNRTYNYPFNPPGISISILTIGVIINDFILAAKIITAFYSAFFIIISFFTIKKMLKMEFKARNAFIFSILLSWVPEYLQYSKFTNTDYAFGCFFLICCWGLMSDFINQKKFLIVVGLSSAIMLYFRWSALFYCICIPLFIILKNLKFNKCNQTNYQSIQIRFDNKTFLRIFSHIILYFGVLFIVISPWLIINTIQNGSPLYNLSYLNLLYEEPQFRVHPTPDLQNSIFTILISEWDYIFQKTVSNFFLGIPYTFFYQNYFIKTGQTGFRLFLSIIFYSILCLGIKRFGKDRIPRKFMISYQNKFTQILSTLLGQDQLPIIILISIFFFQISLGWIIFRFMIPIFPIILVIFGFGLLQIGELITRLIKRYPILMKRTNSSLLSKFSAIFLILIGIGSIFNFYFSLPKEPNDYEIAGSKLREYGNQSQILLAYQSQYYAYFANMNDNPILTENYIQDIESLLEILQNSEFNYFIVSRKNDLNRMPFLSEFFLPNCSYLEEVSLNSIFTISENNTTSLIIFERYET